ncbi:MAG: hypothetical protein Q4A67_00200 [Aerococcus sp.]|nr:hypothetical protein [Aerococcus sp.]
MTQIVYTVYWENKRDEVRKKHGSFKSEEAAMEGIKSWWELQKEHYKDPHFERTNTGALEVEYLQDDDNYVYRIEKEEIEGHLPSTSYKLLTEGEITATRQKYALEEEQYLFDELAEPYRDRLIVAMNDAKKAKSYVYDQRGRMIRPLSD